MLLKALTGVAALVIAAITYFVNDLIAKRRKLAGLPQPPMQNLLLGHLHIADECSNIFPKTAHTHTWIDYMREKYKLPETFYVDWRPFGPLWLYSADPEFVAEYVSVKQNLPKSSLETAYLDKFLGKNNMVSLEADRHKNLRTIFNPGFSQAHLMTYADAIVEATLRFADVLKEKARTQELFLLEEYATRLTIDIIGVAVFDVDMKAQLRLHPIVKHFRDRVLMMPPSDAFFPWQSVDLTRPFKLWWNNRKLEAAISVELEAKLRRRASDIEADNAGRPPTQKRRSIIDLALNAYEKEMAMAHSDRVQPITNLEKMPERLRRDLIDSIKTFFFAGHDTTSSTICWCHYLLHRYPEARAKVIAELDAVFPLGTSVAERIKHDPYVINKLEYLTACIKETLRIFPPASTLRSSNPKFPATQTTFRDKQTGAELFLEGTHIWPAAHLIMRNKRFFPKPTHFIPERFIPSQTPFPEAELFETSGKYAYQPFSVGPRNCIGQELAMIEARIVLALTVREFDFILEYPGEQPDPQPPIPESTAAEMDESTEYGKALRNGARHTHLEGHRVWPVLKGSAKPAGGCPGRVKLRA